MLLNLVKIRGHNFYLPERNEITDEEYRELINLIYLLFIELSENPPEYSLLVHGFHHRLFDRGFDGSDIYIRTRTIDYHRHKAIPDLEFNLIYLRFIQGRGNSDDADSIFNPNPYLLGVTRYETRIRRGDVVYPCNIPDDFSDMELGSDIDAFFDTLE